MSLGYSDYEDGYDSGYENGVMDGEGILLSGQRAAVYALLDACKEFVRKCDCGEARSVRSYAEMKAAIELADKEL